MWSWRDDMRRKREPKPRIAMRGSKTLRASEKSSKRQPQFLRGTMHCGHAHFFVQSIREFAQGHVGSIGDELDKLLHICMVEFVVVWPVVRQRIKCSEFSSSLNQQSDPRLTATVLFCDLCRRSARIVGFCHCSPVFLGIGHVINLLVNDIILTCSQCWRQRRAKNALKTETTKEVFLVPPPFVDNIADEVRHLYDVERKGFRVIAQILKNKYNKSIGSGNSCAAYRRWYEIRGLPLPKPRTNTGRPRKNTAA